MAALVLTKDQEGVLERFVQFLLDPNDHVFVISGYSGTGKSTLIKHLLNRLPDYLRQYNASDYTVQLTATTNKAAENFEDITKLDVSTIHSFLGLRVVRDIDTGESKLEPKDSRDFKYGFLLFVDEASMVDSELLQLIFDRTVECKIVFIGDPSQLLAVKARTSPVFSAGFTEARLTEVVRQAAGNPILDLATNFRNTVETGEWYEFEPDGRSVIHLDREEFDQEVLKEFSRRDWSYKDSKILTYTNQRAIDYNNALREHVKGDPELQVGDYAVCNHYVQVGDKKIKTDEMVHISYIEPLTTVHGVEGNWVSVNETLRVFCPKSRQGKMTLEKRAKALKDFKLLRELEGWIDLRALFAQTIMKSQGSTYDTVFIDLDDIKRCTNANLIARLLYVAVSRARFRCFITGDF